MFAIGDRVRVCRELIRAFHGDATVHLNKALKGQTGTIATAKGVVYARWVVEFDDPGIEQLVGDYSFDETALEKIQGGEVTHGHS